MGTPPPRASVAVAATLGAAIVWGTSFSVNDLGLAHVGPATFATLRFLLAGAVTLAVAATLRRLDTGPLRSPWFWAMAAFNALSFLLQYLGQTLTTPARTALFVNTSAFAVALLERVFLRARLGPARALAILVGVGGAALLVTGGDLSALSGGRLAGDLLTLGAGLGWSAYFVMNRKAVGERDPINVVAWTFALTGVLLVPSLWLDAEPLAMDAAGAAAIVYSGLVTTALAYALWTYGLTRLRASASAVLLLVEILVASLVSLALGRERFGWVDLGGAALLVGAVVAMSLISARDEPEAG